MQLPGRIFKLVIVPSSFPSSFMDGWNANLMVQVPAAILDLQVTLAMETGQSENTKQGSETTETHLSLGLTSFQLVHGKEILVLTTVWKDSMSFKK